MLVFENPHALWSIVIIAFVWGISASSKSGLAKKHLSWVSVLRSLAVLAICVGLAQPVLRLATKEFSVIYALDVSRSVASDYVDKALTWIDEANKRYEPARSSIVIFARNRAVVTSTNEAREIAIGISDSDSNEQREFVDQSGTDLGAAVDEALAILDPEYLKRIVLFSDGNQTTGSLIDIASSAKNSGARIFPLVADAAQVKDTWISNVRLPDRIRAGEPRIMNVEIFAPQAADIELQIRGDDELISRKKFTVDVGYSDLPVTVIFPDSGLVPVDVALELSDDPYAENNKTRVSAWVEKKARVAYLEGVDGSSEFLSKALEQSGIEVDVIDSLPRFDDLKNYDAIVLSDVPASSLTRAMMLDVERFVRDYGGGLIFSGGENTFGKDGYSDTVLERLLPADFEAQEKRKDVAIVIAIDRSYSMKGRKIEYAKEAARASLDLLEEQHYFGVVAFDSQPYVPVPIEPVKSKRKAEALISRIQASGQTNIYPALGIVYRLLRDQEAPTKHVILLSDGDTSPAEFERLVKRMREKDIVISTVTIGEGGNPGLMKQIAEWGEGRNYMATSAQSIPQIFTEETKKVVGTSLIEEPILTVVQQPTQSLSGIDIENAPALKGHIAIKPKETAETILATQQGAPLLTRWQYGLGKTILFTSDVKNRWSTDWIAWDGYGPFWSQVTRSILKQLGSNTVFFSSEKSDGAAVFKLTLLDASGGFINDVTPLLKVNIGDNIRDEVMSQVGPGQYEWRIALDGQSPVSATLVESGKINSEIVDMAGARSVFPDFPKEYRFASANLELLNAVAESTGGRINAKAERIFDPSDEMAMKRLALWPILLILALLCYLADIFSRRSPAVWKRLSD